MARFSICAVGVLALFEGWLLFDAEAIADAAFVGGLGLAFILVGTLVRREWLKWLWVNDP